MPVWSYAARTVSGDLKRSEYDAATREEISRLDQAVDDFAAEMKARLREQAMKG